jgi:DNA-binding transcriptional regulator YiaG
VVRELNSRDWVLTGIEVVNWIKKNAEVVEDIQILQNQKPIKKKKINVVKKVCNELNITQKNLANILEVPEGTVSSWAVKNEIPRLGKKAIEFYIEKQKNQQIVDSYKSFVSLLNAS